MRDLHNSIEIRPAIAPVVATDNTALVSAIIDCSGFDGVEFAIVTGTLADADATFTVLVEHDDAAALGTAAAVPDSSLLGTEATASFTFAADGASRKIGYIGTKRYVRLTITPANNTGNAPIAALAILGFAHTRPTV
jgi:hypothetical protein